LIVGSDRTFVHASSFVLSAARGVEVLQARRSSALVFNAQDAEKSLLMREDIPIHSASTQSGPLFSNLPQLGIEVHLETAVNRNRTAPICGYERTVDASARFCWCAAGEMLAMMQRHYSSSSAPRDLGARLKLLPQAQCLVAGSQRSGFFHPLPAKADQVPVSQTAGDFCAPSAFCSSQRGVPPPFHTPLAYLYASDWKKQH
jgi:hypothetical protein